MVQIWPLPNIDKQNAAKIIVPRLVKSLKGYNDKDGDFSLDNVDVGGIIVADQILANYLVAMLNAPICDFVFRIISKPFQHDYRSANKQFISPLPIPGVSKVVRAGVADFASRLQVRWTERRDLLRQASERLSVLARSRHRARWLWPDLPDFSQLVERAPRGLRLATERQTWARERSVELEAARLETLQAALEQGGEREVRFEDGELRLFVNGAPVLDKIYLDPADERLTVAYWQWLIVQEPARDAKRLAAELRRPPAASVAPAAAQFVERVAALVAEVAAIAVDERALNELLYDLYALTPGERNLVENQHKRRGVGHGPA